MLSYFKAILLSLFVLTGSFLNGMEPNNANQSPEASGLVQNITHAFIQQNSMPANQTITYKHESKSWNENISSIVSAAATQTTATVATSLTIAAISKGYQLLFPSTEESIAQITKKMSALSTLIKINENDPEVLERLLEEMNKLQNQCTNLLCKQAGIKQYL